MKPTAWVTPTVVSILAVALLLSISVTPVAGQLNSTASTSVEDTDTVNLLYPSDGSIMELHLITSADDTIRLVRVQKLNLSDPELKSVFVETQNATERKQDAAQRYENQIKSIASDDDSSNASDVHSSQVSLYTYQHNGTEWGAAEYSVAWDNIATVDGNTVSLTEPLGGDITESRNAVVLVGPEGSTVTETSVEPNVETDRKNSVAWEKRTNMSGFEATVTLDSNDSGLQSGPEDSVPGFTSLTALISLVVVATVILGARRRRNL